MIQVRWTVHVGMKFFGLIAILLLALSACSTVICENLSPCSHRTLVTVDSQVLEYVGHYYELSTFGMEWDHAHRLAVGSSYQGMTGYP